MLNVTIDETIVEQSVQKALDKYLSEGNEYSNPVWAVVKKELDGEYNKPPEGIRKSFVTIIHEKIEAFMKTPHFDLMLGQAVANAIAAREVKEKGR